MVDEPPPDKTLTKKDLEKISTAFTKELKAFQGPHEHTTANQFFVFAIITFALTFGCTIFAAANNLPDWLIFGLLVIGGVVGAIFLIAGLLRNRPREPEKAIRKKKPKRST